MSLGQRLSPDEVGGNFGLVTGFVGTLYDHGIDPAAAVLDVITQKIHALGGTAPILSQETPPVLTDLSLFFDGTTQLNVGDDFDLGAGDFAFALFFRKIDALTSGNPVLISNGFDAANEWRIELNMGSQKRLEWYINGGGSPEMKTANNSTDDENWHHVAVFRLAGEMALYFDGVEADTDTDATDLTNSADLIVGGSNGGGTKFGGVITGYRQYTEALSSAQVSNLNDGNDEPTSLISFFSITQASILSAPASNHGTLLGGAFFDQLSLPGQLQGQQTSQEILAVSLNGTTALIEALGLFALDNSAWSVSIWFRTTSIAAGSKPIVTNNGSVGGGDFLNLRLEGAGLRFGTRLESGFQDLIGGNLNVDQWYHVVGTYDGAGTKFLYLDGIEVDTIGGLTLAANTDPDFNIGRNIFAKNAFFPGRVAQCELWKRELTATEVTAVFNQTSPPEDPFTDFRSNTGLIEDAEPGAPAGTVSTQFDGVDDLVETDQAPFVTAYPYSLTGWVRTTSTSGGTLISFANKDSDSSFTGLDFRASTGLPSAFLVVGTEARALGTTDITDDQWHFLCGTFASSTERRIFVDSVEEASNADSRAFPSGINRTSVGRNGDVTPTGVLEGQIRDATIWNRVLSQADIDALFLHGTRPTGEVNGYPLATEGNLVEDLIGNFANTAQNRITTFHGTLTNYDPDPNLGWVMGVPPQLVGQVSSALSFNGVDQYVSFGTPDANSNSQTIVGFIKMNGDGTTSSGSFFSVGDKANDLNHSRISLGDGQTGTITNELVIVVQDVNGSSVRIVGFTGARSLLFDGAWHHLALVLDGTYKFYLDGLLQTTVIGSGMDDGAWSTINYDECRAGTVARLAAGLPFDGLQSNLSVYGTPLSATDIATLSAGGTIIPVPVDQWLFDDARRYELPQPWIDDAYGDVTRFGPLDVAQGIPKNDSDFVQNVIVPSLNTTGILGASFIAPAGDRFVAGVPGSGVRFLQTGDNTASFDIQSVVPFELSGIEIDANGFAGGNLVTLSGAAHSVHHNLPHDLSNTTGAAAAIELKTGATGSTIHTNTIFAITTTTGACTGILSAVVADIAANSILGIVSSTDGDGAGISVSALAVLRNNVSAGSDFAYVGTAGAGSDSNVDDDGTAPGTNSVTGAAVDLYKNITPGSEDLHLKADSPAILVGGNLMSTGFIGIFEDIDFFGRQASGSWDAGADRFLAGVEGGNGISVAVSGLSIKVGPGIWPGATRR